MTAAVVVLVTVLVVQQWAIMWLLAQRPAKRRGSPRPLPKQEFDRALADTLREAQVAMGDTPKPRERLVGLDGGY